MVENACDVLPNAIDSTCRQFVSQYGAAVIALLVQEMDPAEVVLIQRVHVTNIIGCVKIIRDF